jgi:hypothetical protein
MAITGLDIELGDILGPQAPHGMPSVPRVQKLRTTHHELARMLACGLKDVDISRVTGYSQSRICTLKKDPLFRELLSHYMANRDESAIDFSARLRQLSITAVDIMQEKLEDDSSDISMKDLRQVAEFGLDRTGMGKTMTVNSNVAVTHQTLAEIKASIEKEHKGRVLPRDQRLDSGVDVGAETIELAPTQAPEGSQG